MKKWFQDRVGMYIALKINGIFAEQGRVSDVAAMAGGDQDSDAV